MKSFPIFVLVISALLCVAETVPADEESKPGGTTMAVRAFLIGSKWSWRNVSAGIPDRECLFMADGTFRHPHFVAKFTVKDPHTVVLTRKGGKAVLTFSADFKTFEAIDFNHVRITGSRL